MLDTLYFVIITLKKILLIMGYDAMYFFFVFEELLIWL